MLHTSVTWFMLAILLVAFIVGLIIFLIMVHDGKFKTEVTVEAV
jgi:hypothetical protein